MKQGPKREPGPTPSGNAYSVTTWDDETGESDIQEFNEADELVCRHEWRIADQDTGTGELTTFDAEGNEIARRPIRPAE
jgi:hypothetical protein